MKKESIDRRRFLQALGLFALAGVGSAARAQEGKTFVELSPAQPTLAGKIEVIEFFHYGCPHCRHLDPLVEGWKKTLGGDVAFHRSPVIWGQGALAGLAANPATGPTDFLLAYADCSGLPRCAAQNRHSFTAHLWRRKQFL